MVEKKSFKDRVFSGVQPSGAQVHVGNYLGAMKRFVTISKEIETIVCIVDLHAMTTMEDAAKLSEYTRSLAAAYLAIGMDPKEAIIFRQSDVPEVCELSWYLACDWPLGLLERAHAVKDAKAKNLSINSGTMFYPVLMAADILLYKATKVPVGQDQKQHLEMTREVAERVNYHRGQIFPVPEPLIDPNAATILGLDGRKMSKSYDNYIGLFESPKEMRKKVMRIVTDSKSVEDKKDPDTCNVFQIYKLLASKEEQEALKDRYLAGGMGYGHAKEELFKVLDRELMPLRERYENWIHRPDDITDVLRDAAKRARDIALDTITEVRKAVGVMDAL